MNMQRNYIMEGAADSSENNILKDETNSSPLERHSPSRLIGLARKAPLTTSLSPDQREAEPSKLRRQSSRMLSALKSLTNSISQDSTALAASHANGKPGDITGPNAYTFPKSYFEPTVLHRANLKPRPGLPMSKEKHTDGPNASPDSSPGNSGNDLSNGKDFNVRPGNSTGITSVASQSSSKVLGRFQQSSSNVKEASRGTIENDLSTAPLSPTVEAVPMHETQHFTPTIATVENAAAAKIFFETYYNQLISCPLTPRSLRRRGLEHALEHCRSLTPVQKEEKRVFWARSESDHLRQTRSMKNRGTKTPGSINSPAARYDVVKVLGKGSFGVVRLVREKADRSNLHRRSKKEIYAMKVIRKAEMLRNCQEGHLRAERDFLVAAEGSRWIVPLIASFQDTNNLYLIMDYMPGGDFLGLLIRDQILSESTTRWYIAEMILCLEEAHSLQWIHRDVKPDNFLISASGHLKISDFGLAFDGHWSHDQSYFHQHRYSLLSKLGISVEGDSIDIQETATGAMDKIHHLLHAGSRHRRRSSREEEPILNWRNKSGNRHLAKSVVGTSQYMAPEVVRGHDYDGRCDWWSVAIILYECLYGHTPFLAEEGRQQTKQNISDHLHTLHFPSKPKISSGCRRLMQEIFQEKSNRLSSHRYRLSDERTEKFKTHTGHYVFPNDADEIKSHKWFRGIPWEKLHLMAPPFVPAIKSVDDTQYFDEDEPVSDFSDCEEKIQPTQKDLHDALREFTRDVQKVALEFIATPYDTVRWNKTEKQLDAFRMADEQKQYIKDFMKYFGRKEKKRPRDKLLRDKSTAPKVLELRKRTAFLGYTYRRYVPMKEDYGRPTAGSKRAGHFSAGNPSSKRAIWHRARISIH